MSGQRLLGTSAQIILGGGGMSRNFSGMRGMEEYTTYF